MSKYLKTLIAILSFVLIFQTQMLETYASENISVVVNGEKVIFNGQQPIVKNGRTLVPFRPIFEKIGMSVSFDTNSQTITAKDSKHTVVMKVNDKNFNITNTEHKINGGYISVNYTFDVPPQVIKGTTYVPIGFLFDSIDYSVNYDSTTKTVYLISEEYIIKTMLQAESLIVNSLSEAAENITTNPDYSIEILTDIKTTCLMLKNNVYLGTLTDTLEPLITNFADNMILGSDELINTAKSIKENNITKAQTHYDNANKYYDNAKTYSKKLITIATTYNINSPVIDDTNTNNTKIPSNSSNPSTSTMTKGSEAELNLLTNVTNTMLNVAKSQTSIADDFTDKKYDSVITNSKTVISTCESLKATDLTIISSELEQIKNNFADSTIKTSTYMINSATEMKNGNYSGAYVSAIYGAMDTEDAVGYINDFSDFIFKYYKGMY